MLMTWTDTIRVLLHRVEGPINLGAVCRTMANLGLDQLRFSGELSHSDPLAKRFAVHAHAILAEAVHCDSFAELLKGCDTVYGFSPRSPWPDGRDLDMDSFLTHVREDLVASRKPGLLFGNEAHGLANEHLAHCHWRVALPTHQQYPSMNLATAVSVSLWELHRKLTHSDLTTTAPHAEMASSEEISHLLDNLAAFTDTFALLNPQNEALIAQELTTLFKTRRWSKRELQLLHMLFAKPRARYHATVKKLEAAKQGER